MKIFENFSILSIFNLQAYIRVYNSFLVAVYFPRSSIETQETMKYFKHTCPIEYQMTVIHKLSICSYVDSFESSFIPSSLSPRTIFFGSSQRIRTDFVYVTEMTDTNDVFIHNYEALITNKYTSKTNKKHSKRL